MGQRVNSLMHSRYFLLLSLIIIHQQNEINKFSFFRLYRPIKRESVKNYYKYYMSIGLYGLIQSIGTSVNVLILYIIKKT